MTIKAGKTEGGDALLYGTTNNPQQGSRPIGWNLLEPGNVPVLAELDSSGSPLRTVTPDGQVVGGSADGGFQQSGTGAVARTSQDKLRESVSVKDFGAACDGTANDAAEISLTVQSVAAALDVFVPSDSYTGVSRVAIGRGVRLKGPGKSFYTPSATLGNRVQQPAGRNDHVWGVEYLYQWLVKISSGTAATVRMTGDSTTAAGYSTQLTALLASVANVTTSINGNPSKHTGEWLSTYLASDISAAPTVLIWHWGMNDCSGLGRTLTQFEADLRAGLTTYRASVPISVGGVILMTPNASSDGSVGRDELRNEKMRQIIRNVAEDFQCAFIDTYAQFQDGYVGIGSWLDNPFSDGLRGIHPQTAYSQAIAGEVFKLLVPEGIRSLVVGYGISNAVGATEWLTPSSALSSYPIGISIRRAQSGTGWPLDGWVITTRENFVSTSCIQTLYRYSDDAPIMMRTYTSTGAWGPWKKLGDKQVIDAASATSAAIAANTTYQWFESNTAAAAFAVTLPPPSDNDRLTLAFKNATGAITWTPTAPATTVTRLPTAAIPAKGSITLIYNAGNTAWYPAG